MTAEIVYDRKAGLVTMEGFVIVPPINEWDLIGPVIGGMSHSTFGQTPVHAWAKHIGRYEDPSWSQTIQRRHDRGFRVKKATLTIEYPGVDEDTA